MAVFNISTLALTKHYSIQCLPTVPYAHWRVLSLIKLATSTVSLMRHHLQEQSFLDNIKYAARITTEA